MKLKYRLLFLPILLFACGVASGQEAGMSVAPFVRGDTAVFRFAPEKRMFWADYKGNAIAIDSLARSIRQHKLSIESGDMKVRVLGFCSSYGSCAENLAAAKNRSNQVKSYFIVHEGLKEDHFRTTNSTRQWHGMTDVIGVAYLFRNSETIPASGTLPESGFTSADSVSASQVLKPFVEPDTLIAERSAKPASESTRPIAKALESALGDPVQPCYQWVIKTNVAYLAATVANLGVEFAFGKHYSVESANDHIVPIPCHGRSGYAFWPFSPNSAIGSAHPMKGHFFGAHLNIGAFNISVDKHTRYQSPDGFYGAGVSYGYVLPFARHWGAEFTVGAGYIHTKYDAYYNISNGARYEKGIPYNYWGLTKVGINLVYRFGK